MEEKEIKNLLSAVIYEMFHMIEGDLYDESNRHFKISKETIINQIDDLKKSYFSLKWAFNNKDFNFKSLMPLIHYNNEDILYYFKIKFDFISRVLKHKGINLDSM